MKKPFILGLLLLHTTIAHADNVILMIGDGMGANHLKCAAMDKPLYIPTLPVTGWVKTHSADNAITDSAASATAYACGLKTNNFFLGKLPDGTNCTTIAEESASKGIAVGIYSTDDVTGATPAAFFAHTKSRGDSNTILSDKARAESAMDIAAPVKRISDEVTFRLNKLLKARDKTGFFAMFEGAKIDKRSHANDLKGMKNELYNFDYAVMKAVNFAYQHPDTTVIVLADHETGGLTDDCRYTSTWHTGQNIPLYAYGQHANLFSGTQDNTEIHTKIRNILFKLSPQAPKN